jgi:hypothetical protein
LASAPGGAGDDDGPTRCHPSPARPTPGPDNPACRTRRHRELQAPLGSDHDAPAPFFRCDFGWHPR